VTWIKPFGSLRKRTLQETEEERARNIQNEVVDKTGSDNQEKEQINLE
jgi:hypothetical protein